MPFNCISQAINSCCWVVPSLRCGKVNFYFLNFSSVLFINHWRIHPSNTLHFRFFVVQHIITLYDRWQFSFLADWMHSTSRILLCKPRKLYQSVFAKSSATLVRKSIPNFSYILNQKFIYQALWKYAKFFENIPILKFSNLV